MKFLIKLVKKKQRNGIPGSELVGLVPKKVLIDGIHFLKKQKRSVVSMNLKSLKLRKDFRIR